VTRGSESKFALLPRMDAIGRPCAGPAVASFLVIGRIRCSIELHSSFSERVPSRVRSHKFSSPRQIPSPRTRRHVPEARSLSPGKFVRNAGQDQPRRSSYNLYHMHTGWASTGQEGAGGCGRVREAVRENSREWAQCRFNDSGSFSIPSTIP